MEIISKVVRLVRAEERMKPSTLGIVMLLSTGETN